VSVIKHAHHGFDVDKPGKDSWRHREAGASEILLISDERWVLMHELRGDPEPDLSAQLAIMSPCDLVLVEGFKAVQIPKIEIHRPAHGRPLLYPTTRPSSRRHRRGARCPLALPRPQRPGRRGRLHPPPSGPP
jgi:molybdopterin-guanine dinucleotide biosynthesis protein B